MNHSKNLSKAIEEEAKKYQLSKDLINEFKRVGNSYKNKSEVKIGQNTFVLSSYPIIMMEPSLEKLEAEIESLIRKGPFVEAKFEFKPETLTKN